MRKVTWIGIAVVVAIGLIWSLATLSKWVPVGSAEITSAPISSHEVMVGQGKSASAE
jgi:hypothetical protein